MNLLKMIEEMEKELAKITPIPKGFMCDCQHSLLDRCTDSGCMCAKHNRSVAILQKMKWEHRHNIRLT